MNIDRIAGAMTSGRPRADFTARVMAPIYGRPRPGFTARVVAQAFRPADKPVAQTFRPAMAAALLVPAAIALAAGVMAVRAGRVDLPAAPAAPRLATASLEVRLPNPPEAAVATTSPRIARRATVSAPAEEPTVAQLPPSIYMIAALAGPDDIAMKSIEPAAFTIPALDAPAPLKVADLPGAPGGWQQKEPKE